MILVWVLNYFYKKCFFVAFHNLFLPFGLNHKLFDLFTGLLNLKHPVAKFFISKYTQKNL